MGFWCSHYYTYIRIYRVCDLYILCIRISNVRAFLTKRKTFCNEMHFISMAWSLPIRTLSKWKRTNKIVNVWYDGYWILVSMVSVKGTVFCIFNLWSWRSFATILSSRWSLDPNRYFIFTLYISWARHTADIVITSHIVFFWRRKIFLLNFYMFYYALVELWQMYQFVEREIVT